MTALLLLIWGVPPAPGGGTLEAAPVTSQRTQPPPAAQAVSTAVDDATATVRELAREFSGYLPRLVLVATLLILAAVTARILRLIIHRTLGRWDRASAVTALARLVVFLVAGVATVSILAGDARAVVGSVGLLGLAASWALQTPIESFTGWLLNSFHGYYRVGDRISVGDVFGDVYRIDVLTTTVWEAGGQGKPVEAAQATGAVITFPNWEILRSNVINYSRDFPYVWDEVTIGVANESDLAYTAAVLEDMARRVLGGEMQQAADRYHALLRREGLLFEVEEIPRVYVSASDSWTDCTIRYLVPVRTRRHWSSTLLLEASRETARPEHKGRIIAVYPRREIVVRQQWSDGDHEAFSGSGETA